MVKKKQSEPIPIHIWIGILFIILIVIGSIIHSCNKSYSESTDFENSEIIKSETENNSQESKYEGITYHITQDTYAATCEECFDEMFDYFKNNDQEAIQIMINEGRMKMLYEGQRLYLVDGSLTHAVLREKGSTQKLWIVNEHIKKD